MFPCEDSKTLSVCYSNMRKLIEPKLFIDTNDITKVGSELLQFTDTNLLQWTSRVMYAVSDTATVEYVYWPPMWSILASRGPCGPYWPVGAHVVHIGQ